MPLYEFWSREGARGVTRLMVLKGNLRGLQAWGRFGKSPFSFYIFGLFTAATREDFEIVTNEKAFS